MAKQIAKLERELDEVLDALAGMVQLHCSSGTGAALQYALQHDWIFANEQAFEILRRYGYIEYSYCEYWWTEKGKERAIQAS